MFSRLFVLISLLPSCAFADAKLVYMREYAEQKQIWVANADGTGAKALTEGDLWHLYPEIESSGRLVSYVEGTSQEDLNVVLLDTKTGEKRLLTEGKKSRLHPDFSGNGRFLAWSEDARIVIKDLWAETDAPLVSVPAAEKMYFPTLSSDGSFVVFERSLSKEKKEVGLYRLDTKKFSVVADGVSMSPALSFDDRFVAFTSKKENNWDIYVLDRTKGTTVRVTRDAARDFAPAFRADGGLVFASDRSGNFQLYEISAEEMRNATFADKLLVKGEGDFYAPAVSGEINYGQGLLPKMLEPARSSFGAVRVGHKIYIVGGHQGHEHTYPPESFLANVEYYDTEAKAWHSGAPRPIAAHGYGLAAKGKYIYAFGGFTYSAEHQPKWKSVKFIDRYDTEANEWTRLPVQLAKPRSSNVVAQVGDKVYLIGGWDSTPKKPKDYEGEFLRSIEVFDLKTETVSVSPHTIPDPLRRALSGVVMGDEILLVGGLGQGASHFELLDTVTAYQPSTGRWRELPRLPFATFAPAAGLLGDTLYVFGGMFKTGAMDYEYVNHVFSLPYPWKEWSHTGRYLRGSKGFSMVVSAGCRSLGILGGHSYEGETDSPVLTFEEFGWPGCEE